MATTKRKPTKYNKVLAMEYRKELAKLKKKKVVKEVYDKNEVNKAFQKAAKKAKSIVNAKKV